MFDFLCYLNVLEISLLLGNLVKFLCFFVTLIDFSRYLKLVLQCCVFWQQNNFFEHGYFLIFFSLILLREVTFFPLFPSPSLGFCRSKMLIYGFKQGPRTWYLLLMVLVHPGCIPLYLFTKQMMS